MIATGAGSFSGSSAALLVCNKKMAGFSNTHVWPCHALVVNLARFADGACMTCMVVLHAAE